MNVRFTSVAYRELTEAAAYYDSKHNRPRRKSVDHFTDYWPLRESPSAERY